MQKHQFHTKFPQPENRKKMHMCNEKTAGLKDQLFKCFHTSSGPLLGVSGSDTDQSSTSVHLIHSKWDYCKCDLLRWECSLSGACRRQESCSLAVNLPDYYLFYSQKTGHYDKSCNNKLTDYWPFQLSRLKSHIHLCWAAPRKLHVWKRL